MSQQSYIGADYVRTDDDYVCPCSTDTRMFRSKKIQIARKCNIIINQYHPAIPVGDNSRDVAINKCEKLVKLGIVGQNAKWMIRFRTKILKIEYKNEYI